MASAFQFSAFYNQAFAAGQQLMAVGGTLALTGKAVGGAVTLPTAAGSFSVTRNSATILAAHRLSTTVGARAFTGFAAGVTASMPAATGAYLVSLTMAGKTTRILTAETGTITQTRIAAGLQKAMVPHGTYAYAGGGGDAAIVMPVDGAEYTIGGFTNSRSVGRSPLSSGTYSYAGRDADLPVGAPTETGTIGFIRFDAGFGVSRVGYIGPIQVIQKKLDPEFLWTKIICADAARYTVATNDSYLGRRFSISGEAAFCFVGYAAELQDRRRVTDECGAYIMIDRPALLIQGGVFDFSTAKTVMTVPKEPWAMRCA